MRQDVYLNKELTVNSSEQRELVLHALLLQELVDLNSGQGTLKLLAVELGLLDLLNGLVALHAVLGTAEVTTTAGASDQIGDTGTLFGEGALLDGSAEETVTEADHLHQTNTHDGRLGVVTPAHTDDPAGGNGNHVLQSTANGDTGDIVDDTDVEVRAVEQRLQHSVIHGRVVRGERLQLNLGQVARNILVLELHQVGLGGGGGRGLGVQVWRVVSDGGLAPLLQSNLVGDVGTGKSTTVDTQSLANGLREQADSVLLDVNTLDTRDTTGVWQDLALDGLAGLVDELMGEVEDEDSAVLHGILQRRVRVQVVG